MLYRTLTNLISSTFVIVNHYANRVFFIFFSSPWDIELCGDHIDKIRQRTVLKGKR